MCVCVQILNLLVSLLLQLLNNTALVQRVSLTTCRYSVGANHLTVHDIAQADEGLYVCRITKDGGPIVSVVAGCLIVHGE